MRAGVRDGVLSDSAAPASGRSSSSQSFHGTNGSLPRKIRSMHSRRFTMFRTPQFVLRASLLATTLALGACSMMPMSSGSGSTPMMATQTFRATLSSAAEVPSNASTGSGSLEASLDKGSSVLRWKVTYSGLTGPATMAHFHGPAMPGANAGVVVPFPSPASMTEGTATLTPAQIADLMAGKWYVNVHTAQNPGGEIRGQVMAN
jgi:hypothetical protein